MPRSHYGGIRVLRRGLDRPQAIARCARNAVTELELTIADYVSLCEWFNRLSPLVQDLVLKFSPGTKWQLRDQQFLLKTKLGYIGAYDWFTPVAVTGNGMVDVVRYDCLTGLPVLGVMTLDPDDLIPAGS